MKKTITAGIAIRRKVRRFLLSENIDFEEDKGWIDSEFYLNVNEKTFINIVQTLHDSFSNDK